MVFPKKQKRFYLKHFFIGGCLNHREGVMVIYHLTHPSGRSFRKIKKKLWKIIWKVERHQNCRTTKLGDQKYN